MRFKGSDRQCIVVELKTYPPKFMILNVDFALELSNNRSLKRFIGLKLILKTLPSILQSQKHYLQYCNLSSTTIHCLSLPLNEKV